MVPLYDFGPQFPKGQCIELTRSGPLGSMPTLPTIMSMIERGAMVDYQTWTLVRSRILSLLTFIACFCDEYTTEWERSSTVPMVGLSALAVTDAGEEDLIELFQRQLVFCRPPRPGAR